jgi:integrase
MIFFKNPIDGGTKMPRILLPQQFSDNPPVVESKTKTDFFDTRLTGFFLEVRATGKATYYQRYRDKYRRNRQVRIGPADAMTLEEAREAARQVRSGITNGYDPSEQARKRKEVPLFSEFVENRYLPHVKVYKRSWSQDEQMIQRHIMPLWSQAKLTEITREDIQDFQALMIADGMKPGSVNRYMALVKYIFNLAEKWEVIDKSPARGVSRMADHNRKERYLTKEETVRLLAVLKKSPNRVMADLITFLILTGARKSEATHARWENVNLETGVWTVPMSKSGKPRYIPLSKAAIALLKNRRINGSEYVFPSPSIGKPMIHTYPAWDKIRRQAGIPDVRIHDLRHNFASLLVNNGRSLYEVQKLLGHADISTTQRYAHLSQDTLKDATEIVSLSLKSDVVVGDEQS